MIHMAYDMMSQQKLEATAADYQRIVASASIDDPFMIFSKRYEALCVSIVDVVNSTSITAKLSLDKATQYYSVFLNSMAKTANIFGARVVKNIGDSLLLYFPTDISLEQILDCNTAMLRIRKFLNDAFRMRGLPEIDYRISSDYGPTMIATCKKTSQEDIFGNSVNMCSKINRLADKNSLVIGSDLYSLAKGIHRYSFCHTKSYSSGFKLSYPVYDVMPRYR